MRRSHSRRAIVALSTVALLLPVFALTAHAQVATVTGSLTFAEEVTLSPTAVAVITLADRSKSGAGTIIGQQRIDAAKGPEIAFSVEYDSSVVNQSHAYAVVASVIDAGVEWQNPVAVPTITGGETEGLAVELSVPDYTAPTQVTGTITLPAGTVFSATAVSYAIVLNGDTGRVIGRQVNPAPTGAAIPFAVTYDADLVDPAAPIFAVGAAADGTTLWKTAAPAPVTAGTPLDLEVAESGTIPGPTPVPTEEPTPTAGGTVEPTVTPTGNPTAEPTEEPTEEPTATATAEPTATPTEEPTGSPSPTPSVTPSASPSPTPSPGAIVVTGTLTYREPHRLDLTSVARVVVAQLQGDGTLNVVGQVDLYSPGQVPIAFSVVLNSDLDPTLETRLWAVIKDGTEVWTSAGAGIAVATNGAPTENVLVGMFFRPDLIEADVTGTITGTPTDLSGSAWAMTWIVDVTAGKVVSLDSSLVGGANPIPFQVPFAVAEVTADGSYVVQAAVFDGEREWRSSAGTPVITGGNPLKDVEVTVAQVGPTATPTPAATATAAATPSAAASATPAPTATGGTGTGSGGGVDQVVLGILALVVIGGAVVIYFVRR